MVTDWITVSMSPEGMLIDKLLYVFMFFAGMFCGWQLCLQHGKQPASVQTRKNRKILDREKNVAGEIKNRVEAPGYVAEIEPRPIGEGCVVRIRHHSDGGNWRPKLTVVVNYSIEEEKRFSLRYDSDKPIFFSKGENMMKEIYSYQDSYSL